MQKPNAGAASLRYIDCACHFEGGQCSTPAVPVPYLTAITNNLITLSWVYSMYSGCTPCTLDVLKNSVCPTGTSWTQHREVSFIHTDLVAELGRTTVELDPGSPRFVNAPHEEPVMASCPGLAHAIQPPQVIPSSK